MTLFELIRQTEQLLDAIASHSDYTRLQEGNHLTNLDFTLADMETFLMQLNQALGEMIEPQATINYPTFEEIFGSDSLTNSLTLLEPTVRPINSLDDLLEERS